MGKTVYSDLFISGKYRLIVLDMDGTLYYQRAMQIRMGAEMAAFALRHPSMGWKLEVISDFRKVREDEKYCYNTAGAGSLLEEQYAVTATKTGRTKQQIKEVIEEWIFGRPLKYLPKVADRKLIDWVTEWKKQGKTVVVFSDYPVKEKCEALNILPDGMYSSDEERIGEMKPGIKGLQMIADEYQIPFSQILVVGDRMSKDGEMAKQAGCDYVILDKWKILRKKKY